MSALRSAAAGLAAACVICVAAAVSHADNGQSTARAERGALVLRVERPGVVGAARVVHARVAMRAYTGPLEIKRITGRVERVDEGQPLAELVARDLPRVTADARVELEHAERSFALARGDAKQSRRKHELEREAAEHAVAQAERALNAFETVESAYALRAAELKLEERRRSLDNQKEELAQLERMYAGAELAGETREIVLERARRSVRLGEAYLLQAERQLQLTLEHTHPERKLALERAVHVARDRLEQLLAAEALQLERKEIELRAQARRIEELRRRLLDLASDAEALVVRAPAAGLLELQGLAVGDRVKGDTVVARIHDPAHLEVAFDVGAADLRVLQPGTHVEVRVGGWAELRLEGEVTTVTPVGRRNGGSAAFAAAVRLADPPALVRPGMDVVVFVSRSVGDALQIPEGAVYERHGRSWCKVSMDGRTHEREVVCGARANGIVEVISGVEEDEEVLTNPGDAAETVSGGGAHGAVDPEGADGEAEPAPAPGRGEDDTGALRLPERRQSRTRKQVRRVKAPGPAAAAGETAKRPAGAPATARALERGVAFLLESQNDDGSWGSFASARPFEIWLGTVASHRAFGQATTALACMALREAARGDEATRGAVERAVRYLAAEPAAGRATGDTFYDTWAHVYALEAAARLRQEPELADVEAELDALIRRELECIVRRQAADGGWGYYDFGYGGFPPSGIQSTSFLTGAVVLALDQVQAAGFDVPAGVIEAGLACVDRLRLPNGAYVYGNYAALRPGAFFNRPKGSLGRSQPCNLALWRFGTITDAGALVSGVERLVAEHHFLEIGQGRPYPHESWYATAGYYVLFGHYYAAQVLEELLPEDRGGLPGRLADWLASVQSPDGSWMDFPLYGYHKAYGTAYAVLTLQALSRCS
jgi:hypothetical protein